MTRAATNYATPMTSWNSVARSRLSSSENTTSPAIGTVAEIATTDRTPTTETAAAATMPTGPQLPVGSTTEHIYGKIAPTTGATSTVTIPAQKALVKTPTPVPKVPVQGRVLEVKSRVQKIRKPLMGHQ